MYLFDFIQNLLVHRGEKILLMQPVTLGGISEPRVMVPAFRHALITSCLETSRFKIVASVTVRLSRRSSDNHTAYNLNAGPSESAMLRNRGSSRTHRHLPNHP